MNKVTKVSIAIWQVLPASLILIVVGIVSLTLFSKTEASLNPEGNLTTRELTRLRTSLSTEPCQLPAAGGVFNNPGALGGPVFAQGQGVLLDGAAQFVITCLRFDRSHYPYGAGWHSELVVKNAGVTNSGPFDVQGELCRHMANGITFQCSSSVWNLGSVSSGLAPGESVLLQSNSFGFSLQLDPSDAYPSWVDGLPDNGTVYLRARIATMPAGQYNVTQAIYPTAPSDLSGDSNFVDQDQDGWSPFAEPDDCVDSDPNIHPGALEIAGDGADNDCEGGDVGLGGPCDAYYGIIHGETALCGQPGAILYPGTVDMDGDSVSVSEGDCDDSDPWINPFAPELNDSLDNNCNGLVDETFAVPDWIIEDYDVVRTMGEHTLANGFSIQIPGLDYDVTLGNIGDYIGDDFSSIQAVGHYVIFHSQPMATGTSGFIPYTQLPIGYLYGCTEQALTAAIADTGIYGEINTANNYETFWLPPITGDYLSLHFDEMPSLSLAGGPDSTLVLSHAAITGSCPDLPTTLDGGTDYIQIHRRLIGKNQVLHNETLVGVAYTPAISMPEDVSGGDLFCLQVTLDPNHLVSEVDTDDNMYAIVYEYHNPFFGPPRFDVVEHVQGPAGPVDFNTDDCVVSVEGALMGGSPGPSIVLIGAVLVGLAGGAAGGILGRATGAGRAIGLLLAGGGVILGSGVGGVVGNATSGRPAPEAVINTQSRQAGPVPSCDVFLDPDTALPAEGAVFPDFPGNLELSLALRSDSAELTPSMFTTQLLSPMGREAFLDGRFDGSGDRVVVEAANDPALRGSSFLAETGEYRWSVASGNYALGGDVNPLQAACQGSSVHSFVIKPGPTITPTATPTATPTEATIIPPTSTPTKPGAPEPTKKPPKLTPTPTTKPTKPA